jgi:hypothetical protein
MASRYGADPLRSPADWCGRRRRQKIKELCSFIADTREIVLNRRDRTRQVKFSGRSLFADQL